MKLPYEKPVAELLSFRPQNDILAGESTNMYIGDEPTDITGPSTNNEVLNRPTGASTYTLPPGGVNFDNENSTNVN